MKCRIGFVTNSSSSSFIFGKPGGHELTIEEVNRQVVDMATTLYNNAMKVRESMQASGIDLDKISWDDRDKLENQYSSWCKELDKEGGFPDGITFEAATDKYDFNRLRYIVENKKVNGIISFWDTAKNSDISSYNAEEIAYWYASDVNEEFDNTLDDSNEERVDKALKFCNKHYGEVAITGECGDLPWVMERILMEKLEFACNHMG